jgi:chromosome segregation ATPase
MSEEEKEGTSIEIGGIKFTGGKMMIIATALSTAGGALWGGFEVYKDYMDMKEKIQSYEAPDLSKFQEQLSVMQNEMKKVQDSVGEARDYTRDIKLDIKKDVDRIESISDKTEQRVKDIQESTRESITSNENKVRGLIDIASQRFDNKRDELRNESDRKMKDLEDRLNSKLQRALDNPLAK